MSKRNKNKSKGPKCPPQNINVETNIQKVVTSEIKPENEPKAEICVVLPEKKVELPENTQGTTKTENVSLSEAEKNKQSDVSANQTTDLPVKPKRHRNRKNKNKGNQNVTEEADEDEPKSLDVKEKIEVVEKLKETKTEETSATQKASEQIKDEPTKSKRNKKKDKNDEQHKQEEKLLDTNKEKKQSESQQLITQDIKKENKSDASCQSVRKIQADNKKECLGNKAEKPASVDKAMEKSSSNKLEDSVSETIAQGGQKSDNNKKSKNKTKQEEKKQNVEASNIDSLVDCVKTPSNDEKDSHDSKVSKMENIGKQSSNEKDNNRQKNTETDNGNLKNVKAEIEIDKSSKIIAEVVEEVTNTLCSEISSEATAPSTKQRKQKNKDSKTHENQKIKTNLENVSLPASSNEKESQNKKFNTNTSLEKELLSQDIGISILSDVTETSQSSIKSELQVKETQILTSDAAIKTKKAGDKPKKENVQTKTTEDLKEKSPTRSSDSELQKCEVLHEVSKKGDSLVQQPQKSDERVLLETPLAEKHIEEKDKVKQASQVVDSCESNICSKDLSKFTQCIKPASDQSKSTESKKPADEQSKPPVSSKPVSEQPTDSTKLITDQTKSIECKKTVDKQSKSSKCTKSAGDQTKPTECKKLPCEQSKPSESPKSVEDQSKPTECSKSSDELLKSPVCIQPEIQPLEPKKPMSDQSKSTECKKPTEDKSKSSKCTKSAGEQSKHSEIIKPVEDQSKHTECSKLADEKLNIPVSIQPESEQKTKLLETIKPISDQSKSTECKKPADEQAKPSKCIKSAGDQAKSTEGKNLASEQSKLSESTKPVGDLSKHIESSKSTDKESKPPVCVQPTILESVKSMGDEIKSKECKKIAGEQPKSIKDIKSLGEQSKSTESTKPADDKSKPPKCTKSDLTIDESKSVVSDNINKPIPISEECIKPKEITEEKVQIMDDSIKCQEKSKKGKKHEKKQKVHEGEANLDIPKIQEISIEKNQAQVIAQTPVSNLKCALTNILEVEADKNNSTNVQEPIMKFDVARAAQVGAIISNVVEKKDEVEKVLEHKQETSLDLCFTDKASKDSLTKKDESSLIQECLEIIESQVLDPNVIHPKPTKRSKDKKQKKQNLEEKCDDLTSPELQQLTSTETKKSDDSVLVSLLQELEVKKENDQILLQEKSPECPQIEPKNESSVKNEKQKKGKGPANISSIESEKVISESHEKKEGKNKGKQVVEQAVASGSTTKIEQKQELKQIQETENKSSQSIELQKSSENVNKINILESQKNIESPEESKSPASLDVQKIDKKRGSKSPAKTSKNLRGPSSSPAKSNKYDYKKEKNKAECIKEAATEASGGHGSSNVKTKIKDEKSSPDVVSIESVEDLEEEFVYKYSFRTVFIANACHICKTQLKDDRIVCRFCHLVGYCTEAHRDDDWATHQSLCYAICTLSHVKAQDYIYADAKSLSGQDYRLLRMQGIVSCEKILKRKLSPWEQEVLLYPRMCLEPSCREWKSENLKDCDGCGQVSFCKNIPTHFQADHQTWCSSYRLYHKLVTHQLHQGRIEPTLPTTIFQEKITLPDETKVLYDLLYGTEQKFDECYYATLTQLSSAPLSALYAYQKTCDPAATEKKTSLCVHIIGAELQFEADTLNKWEAFFLHLVPGIQELRIIFVGPELNTSNLPVDLLSRIRMCQSCKQKDRLVKFEFHDSVLYHDFVESSKFSKPDLICAFNPGFHRITGYAGLDTWPETIGTALRLRVPLCLTAYTQFEMPRDLVRVQTVCPNVQIKLGPIPNPYSSLRPDRNFISDDEMPLIFKNYQLVVVSL